MSPFCFSVLFATVMLVPVIASGCSQGGSSLSTVRTLLQRDDDTHTSDAHNSTTLAFCEMLDLGSAARTLQTVSPWVAFLMEPPIAGPKWLPVEAEFSMSAGLWRWVSFPSHAPGAEVTACFVRDGVGEDSDNEGGACHAWERFCNVMGSTFSVSLAQAAHCGDGDDTDVPLHSRHNVLRVAAGERRCFHTTLLQESLCTENLAPMQSLFFGAFDVHPEKFFSTMYQSMRLSLYSHRNLSGAMWTLGGECAVSFVDSANDSPAPLLTAPRRAPVHGLSVSGRMKRDGDVSAAFRIELVSQLGVVADVLLLIPLHNVVPLLHTLAVTCDPHTTCRSTVRSVFVDKVSNLMVLALREEHWLRDGLENVSQVDPLHFSIHIAGSLPSLRLRDFPPDANKAYVIPGAQVRFCGPHIRSPARFNGSSSLLKADVLARALPPPPIGSSCQWMSSQPMVHTLASPDSGMFGHAVVLTCTVVGLLLTAFFTTTVRDDVAE